MQINCNRERIFLQKFPGFFLLFPVFILFLLVSFAVPQEQDIRSDLIFLDQKCCLILTGCEVIRLIYGKCR